VARELSGLAGASDNKSVAEIGAKHFARGCERRMAGLRAGVLRFDGGASSLEACPLGRVEGGAVQAARSGCELTGRGGFIRRDKPGLLRRVKRMLRTFNR